MSTDRIGETLNSDDLRKIRETREILLELRSRQKAYDAQLDVHREQFRKLGRVQQTLSNRVGKTVEKLDTLGSRVTQADTDIVYLSKTLAETRNETRNSRDIELQAKTISCHSQHIHGLIESNNELVKQAQADRNELTKCMTNFSVSGGNFAIAHRIK